MPNIEYVVVDSRNVLVLVFGVGRGSATAYFKQLNITICYKGYPIWTDALELSSQENVDVIFGTLNVQILNGSVYLKTFEKD